MSDTHRKVSFGHRVGRMLLAGQFVYGGWGAASSPGRRPKALERAGLPGGEELVRANGAAMVAGGVALALGILPRTAALGLAASLVPTTVVGHPFWREQEPAARRTQQLQFMKNLSMLGGLVIEATARR